MTPAMRASLVRNVVATVAALIGIAQTSAQEALWQKPLVPGDWFCERPSAPLSPEAAGGSPRTPRLRLLGLPAGFLQDPLGIDDDNPSADPLAPRAADDDPLSLLVSVGSYNPYFDWRGPGQPAGLGYYKLYSQMQLLDLGSTSVCLGLQALTPAGLQAGGLEQGPTLLTPSFAWFHDFGDGIALQGFVGQDIVAHSRWSENLDRGIRCGLAWQCPLLFWDDDPEQGLFFFLQGLASYRPELDHPGARTPAWEVIPGIHWRLGSNCWMSVGASRRSLLTWSWQF